MITLKNRRLLAFSLATTIFLSTVSPVFAEVMVDDSFKDVGVTILEERDETKELPEREEFLQEDSAEKTEDNISEDKSSEENLVEEENNLESTEEHLTSLIDDESAVPEKSRESQEIENDVLDISDEPLLNPVASNYSDFIFKDSAKTIIIGYKGSRLDDIVIPSDVVEIGAGAFAASPSKGTFTGRLDLSQARDLRTIGVGAFAGNNFTGDLVINSQNLTEISDYAFFGNEFRSVDLENTNIRNIGKAAFSHSAGADAGRISLPTSITNISDDAFTGEATRGSLTLTKFDDATGRVVGTETISLDKEREPENYGYSYVNLSRDHHNLTNIGSNAFSYNKLTDNLVIPGSVKTIGENAFTRNQLSGSFTLIEAMIETIGDNAFLNAYTNGEDIIIKDCPYLNYIGKGAFQNNTFSGNLTLSSLPQVKEINDFTFFSGKDSSGNERYFKGTLTLEYMNNLERIGKKSFSYETELDPTLARNLTEVRTYNERTGHLNGFTTLKMTELPNLKTIDTQAFMDNNFDNQMDFSVFPNLETIGAQAFSNAGFIETTNFKGLKHLKTIGNSAFFNSEMSNVNFENSSIERIESLAFSGARINGDLKIENLNNLTNIGLAAFQNAGTEESFGDILIKNNPALQQIEQAAFNDFWSQGNVNISGNSNLTKIAEHAFSKNYNAATDENNEISKGLRFGPKLIIKNNGLKTIGKAAFYNNTFKGILSMTDNPITTIGENAFAANGFTCIELPNTVQPVKGMLHDENINHAFSMNNQGFNGKIHDDYADMQYFNLPIYVKDGEGVSSLTSLEDEYIINFSGACQELALVKVKVLDDDTGELISDSNVEIKLINDVTPVPGGTFSYNEIAKGTKGNPNVTFEDVNMQSAQPYAYIDGVDNDKYDTSPIKAPIEVPAPVDGVSEVVVRLPKNEADLTINFLIEGTTDKVPGIKPNPIVMKDQKIGTTFNVNNASMQTALENLKNNYGYEIVPGQETSITLKKGSNVLNIYFRSMGKTINLVKKDEKDPTKVMPCIKYGLYDKAKYDQAVQINDLAARQQAIAASLIETKTTDENGKVSFKNVTVNVRIVELGIDTGCAKCGRNNNQTCDYDNYIPNKKVTEINITDFPDGGNIDYTGSVVNIIVPHTGTLGLIPYVTAFAIIASMGFVLIKKKRVKRG